MGWAVQWRMLSIVTVMDKTYFNSPIIDCEHCFCRTVVSNSKCMFSAKLTYGMLFVCFLNEVFLLVLTMVVSLKNK